VILGESMYLDSEVIDIALRTIYISGSATLLASLWSIPISYTMAMRKPRSSVEAILEALVGLPTVLLGLLLYYLFNSSGPLGFLQLLYTPTAMIIGEAILITPILISVSYRYTKTYSKQISELAISLGATRIQTQVLIIRETSAGLTASIIMGFSRAMGELGIALMVGGNLKDYTRVMTTAIAFDVSRGEFERGLVLGLLLLLIMILIAIAIKSLGVVGARG